MSRLVFEIGEQRLFLEKIKFKLRCSYDFMASKIGIT